MAERSAAQQAASATNLAKARKKKQSKATRKKIGAAVRARHAANRAAKAAQAQTEFTDIPLHAIPDTRKKGKRAPKFTTADTLQFIVGGFRITIERS